MFDYVAFWRNYMQIGVEMFIGIWKLLSAKCLQNFFGSLIVNILLIGVNKMSSSLTNHHRAIYQQLLRLDFWIFQNRFHSINLLSNEVAQNLVRFIQNRAENPYFVRIMHNFTQLRFEEFSKKPAKN